MICGIDESGRGPLAGPLVLAGVVLNKSVYKLNDSKKLTKKERESLFEKIKKNSSYKIVIVDNMDIDKNGLSFSINSALKEILLSLDAKEYIFDGNSNFGVSGIKTVIKADQKIKEVMAASILAKVTRDDIMCKLSLKYPQYNFCKHKGYATKEHIELIKKFGYCKIHRKSYKLKSLQPTLF